MPKRDKQLTEPLVQWLADEMTRQGVDEADLSRRAKMQQAQVWKLLRRKVSPELATLQRLARALGRELPALAVASSETLPSRQETPPGSPASQRSDLESHARVGEGEIGSPGGRGGAATVAEQVSPLTDSALTPPPGAPSEQEMACVALVLDALVAAVEDILARDHELELTHRGRALLGDIFAEVGMRLQVEGHVDATRLFDVVRTLKRGGKA